MRAFEFLQSSLSLLFLLGPIGLTQSAPASSSYELTLTNNNITPDGFTRSAALVNGQYPAPVLQFKKGDAPSITVHNRLTDPTMARVSSIHWHGILQSRNVQQDGKSSVTQCPISPLYSYTYNLNFGNQTGTYWYHSDTGAQYIDGVRGPLIIYDPDDPHQSLYDVDDETTVITLSDWYHNTSLNLIDAWQNHGAFEPIPDSGLINGIGRFANGPQVRRTRISVTQGKRYRFRVIATSGASGGFTLSMEGHSMTVIEIDGVSTQPYQIDSIFLGPGQRASIVVNADQPVGNYWIRATQTILGNVTTFLNPNFNGSDVFAVLHYDGASSEEPTTSQAFEQGPNAFNESLVVPLDSLGAPGGSNPPDYTFNLTFTTDSPTGTSWTINGISYKPPTTPTLSKLLDQAENATFAPTEHTFTIARGAIVELVFHGTTGHYIHIHGVQFSVIQSSSGGPPNYINPPRRDVVITGDAPNGDPLRLRFLAENTGSWYLRCHVEWHGFGGFAAVFAEDAVGVPEVIKPNREWDRLCEIYEQLPDSMKQS